MLRILIRQVVESRHRQPKSIGIAEIEPASDLPFLLGQTPRDYVVRLYHPPPDDRRVRFSARLTVPPGRAPESWLLLCDALNQFFPPQHPRQIYHHPALELPASPPYLPPETFAPLLRRC